MRYRCSTARRYSNRATPGMLTEQHPVAFCFEERGAFFVSRYPCRHFTVFVLRPPPLTPPHKGEGNTPPVWQRLVEIISECVALTVRARLLDSRGPASACESMHVKIEFDGFGRGAGRARRAGRADGRAGANGIAGTVLAATAGAVHRRPRARKRAGHRRATVRRSAVQA